MLDNSRKCFKAVLYSLSRDFMDKGYIYCIYPTPKLCLHVKLHFTLPTKMYFWTTSQFIIKSFNYIMKLYNWTVHFNTSNKYTKYFTMWMWLKHMSWKKWLEKCMVFSYIQNGKTILRELHRILGQQLKNYYFIGFLFLCRNL